MPPVQKRHSLCALQCEELSREPNGCGGPWTVRVFVVAESSHGEPETHYHEKDHSNLLIAEVVMHEAADDEAEQTANTSEQKAPRPSVRTRSSSDGILRFWISELRFRIGGFQPPQTTV